MQFVADEGGKEGVEEEEAGEDEVAEVCGDGLEVFGKPGAHYGLRGCGWVRVRMRVGLAEEAGRWILRTELWTRVRLDGSRRSIWHMYMS